jgi:molecular chaperone DnaJ
METKTYYMILGVSRSENDQAIRVAYRDLAKKLHSDVAGEQSTRAFQELAEAYQVLSDPQRRREYNNRLRRMDDSGGVSIPVRRTTPDFAVRAPVSILGHPETIRPSFDAMYERFFRNFTGIGIPKSEHLEGLTFEVLLSREEAINGCVVPVGVPVFIRCSECGGAGHDWLFPCARCGGDEWIESERTVPVRIPPMTPSGSVFEIPLESLSIDNFYVRLLIMVDA